MAKSNIIFRRVNDASPERVFGSFVDIVHLELAKDVFAVGSDGVDAGKTFNGDLFGCFSQGDRFQYFRFGSGQDGAFFRLLPYFRVGQQVGDTPTDVALGPQAASKAD